MERSNAFRPNYYGTTCAGHRSYCPRARQISTKLLCLKLVCWTTDFWLKWRQDTHSFGEVYQAMIRGFIIQDPDPDKKLNIRACQNLRAREKLQEEFFKHTQ
ncbi:hypothetical protein HELRODRAFT_182596 [Helobdella robusta]|uniref:Uncharacterized protein n=1 Tax=Helobdella robusta TaxID=6412 RepID=T1FIF8_HELRO|nr:hypothetical protein HELRODRAFT_182596 [Helobdella robusta]ESN90768.1 hypothetical protein HELRODRAFT_182596 [Helobdella robusta]